MVRTQIYLTEEERDGLSVLAEGSGKKQSKLIREAIDRFIHQFSRTRRDAVLKDAAGFWRGRNDLPDFDGIRGNWDRT